MNHQQEEISQPRESSLPSCWQTKLYNSLAADFSPSYDRLPFALITLAAIYNGLWLVREFCKIFLVIRAFENAGLAVCYDHYIFYQQGLIEIALLISAYALRSQQQPSLWLSTYSLSGVLLTYLLWWARSLAIAGVFHWNIGLTESLCPLPFPSASNLFLANAEWWNIWLLALITAIFAWHLKVIIKSPRR